MYRTQSFHLKRMLGLEAMDEKTIAQALGSRFTTGADFGYLGSEISDGRVGSTIVFPVNSYRNEFDHDSGAIASYRQTTLEKVSFEISMNPSVLKIFAGGSRASRALELISRSFLVQVSIDDIFVNSFQFFKKIEDDNLNPKIVGLTIGNFQYERGVTGRYAASISNHLVGRKILATYNRDVEAITIQIPDEFGSLWTVANTGKVSIRTEIDFLSIQTDHLIDLILRSTDA